MKVSLIAVTYGVTVDLELPSKRSNKENRYYLTYVADPRKSQFSFFYIYFFICSAFCHTFDQNPSYDKTLTIRAYQKTISGNNLTLKLLKARTHTRLGLTNGWQKIRRESQGMRYPVGLCKFPVFLIIEKVICMFKALHTCKKDLTFTFRSYIQIQIRFRSFIHFEFIFVYGVRKCSSFILLQVVDQFSQR